MGGDTPSDLTTAPSATRRTMLSLAAAAGAGVLAERLAAPESAAAAEKVLSVNEKTGAVVLNASNVGAIPCEDVAASKIENGDTNQSTAIQAILNKVSEQGGGVVFFPLTNKLKPYYRMQSITVPSNVWLMQQPGVEFRPPKESAEWVEHPNILEFSSGWEADTYTENVGAIGRLRINILEYKTHPNSKAICFFNVRNAHFDWIDIVPCESPIGAIEFSPNYYGKGVEAVADLTPTNMTIGLITYNSEGTVAPEKCSGGGAVQFGGGRDVHIGAIKSVGGISLRVETDALEATSSANEEVDGLRVDYVSCEEGYSAASFVDHYHTIKNVDLGVLVARACACGVYLAPEKGHGYLGSIHIGAVFVTGGTTKNKLNKENHEEVTGKSSEGFSERQEGVYSISGTMESYTSPVRIDMVDVRGVSGSGVWGFPNMHIGTLTVEGAEQYGVRDTNASETVKGTRARIDRVKIINCCKYLKEHSEAAAGMLSGYMERWDIAQMEVIDNRGTSYTEYGATAWKATTIVIEDLVTSGMSKGPWDAAEETSHVLTGAAVERGTAKLSAGKVTVKASTATATSNVTVSVLGTPIAVAVTERKAGSFVIEAAASSTAEVSWVVWPA
jgi:hypothetical protein